jgi:transcriptional regulator of arginine metabolism
VTSADRRRGAVARIIGTGRIATQEQLLESVRRAGFHTTQATLSRDLARLGARRVSLPSGGSVYELRGSGPDALMGLVSDVLTNGWLVVVRGAPGSAPAVARAIDLAELPGVLGTIAGDDTVFVAPARERGARALGAELARFLGVSGAPRGT